MGTLIFIVASKIEIRTKWYPLFRDRTDQLNEYCSRYFVRTDYKQVIILMNYTGTKPIVTFCLISLLLALRVKYLSHGSNFPLNSLSVGPVVVMVVCVLARWGNQTCVLVATEAWNSSANIYLMFCFNQLSYITATSSPSPHTPPLPPPPLARMQKAPGRRVMSMSIYSY